MTFQIGEKVVYSNRGIGTIENISSRSFGSHFEKFYLLRLATGRMTVMVPFSHASAVVLRKITTNGEWERVLSFLSSGRCACCRDWKNRFKENTEKMRSGGPLQIAEVLKSLLLVQQQKPLSFREKKMLDCARQMLTMELSIARGTEEAGAAGMIQRALSKAALELPRPL